MKLFSLFLAAACCLSMSLGLAEQPPTEAVQLPPGLEDVAKKVALSKDPIRERWQEALEDIREAVRIQDSLTFDPVRKDGAEARRAVFKVRIEISKKREAGYSILVSGESSPSGPQTVTNSIMIDCPTPPDPKADLASLLASKCAEIEFEDPPNHFEHPTLGNYLVSGLRLLPGLAKCEQDSAGVFHLTLPTDLVFEVGLSEDKSEVLRLEATHYSP
jgi:hypothetical protein